MRLLRALGAGLYDFVIGDDALIAVVVVASLGLTAGLSGAGIEAWWVMPAAVVAGLGASVARGAGR